MALKPIEIILNAKDNTSKVLDGLNTKMKAVAAAIAAYFGFNAFVNVVKGAADFEEAMSRVQAATNASGVELEKLKVTAEQAGANTKFTAIEAAGALENLAKAGLDSEQAIAALPAVMNMAQAGGVSLADASERLTGAVMGMGLKFEESGRVADVLALGANSSKTSINGMAEAMSYAAPVAKQVGLSLESTVAIIGQFSNANIDASRAGTALNSILAQFSDPASKFREELAAIGIRTTNFDEALKKLAAAGPSGAAAIRAVGLEAGPALQGALNLGIPALEALRAKLGAAEGSAAATAKIMGDNLNGSLKGLSSAWDTVKNKLGEPVLPVLKSGVDELAGALKKSVEDGTIAKFGTSLATAFQAAIEWVRQFVATMDMGKVTADIQAFATRAGEVFDQIGQYATNAGNIVKLAYGVMSAGTNVVLTGIYGIGAMFAKMAEEVMTGVAKLRDGLASVTFGGLSESFKLAAEDARNMAKGFGETAVAMRAKFQESMQGMADGAQLAQDGFVGLSAEVDKTKVATDAGAKGLEDLREAMRKESEAAYAAIEATDKKAEADTKAAEATTKAKQASDDAKAAIKALGDEYKQAVAGGDWQKAATLQAQINQAMRDTAPAAAGAGKAGAESGKQIAQAAGEAKTEIAKLQSQYKEALDLNQWEKAAILQRQLAQAIKEAGPASKEAADAAKAMAAQVSEAYTGLGVTSTTKMKELANQSRANFEIIKNSGTASAIDIGKAFAAYAERAIAANGGVATAAIKTEAVLRGYKVEVDDTGKNTLKLVTATDGLAASFAKAGIAAKQKAETMKADNDLVLSGLNLRKSEIDGAIAVAQAQGKESEVIKLKIEQKKIEIAIIQATVKAQTDEAQSSISVAEAKMAELRNSGSLTEEKKAELEVEIKSAQAKINDAKARGESVRVLEQEIKGLQGSTSGHNANTSAINQATAALEALNAQEERRISALEKSNELETRDLKLQEAKRNAGTMNPVDQVPQFNSQTEAEAWKQQWMDQYNKLNVGKVIGFNERWGLDLMRAEWDAEVNQMKMRNAVKKASADEEATQQNKVKREESIKAKPPAPAPIPIPKPPAPSPTPTPTPAPHPQWDGNGGSASITPAPSYTSIVNLPGIGSTKAKFDTSAEQQNMEAMLRTLSSAAGVAQ